MMLILVLYEYIGLVQEFYMKVMVPSFLTLEVYSKATGSGWGCFPITYIQMSPFTNGSTLHFSGRLRHKKVENQCPGLFTHSVNSLIP